MILKKIKRKLVVILKSIHFFIARKYNPYISKKYKFKQKWTYQDCKTGKNEQLLPNLVVIGAQRSGTTSLYHYLKSHPNIFMSTPLKEPGFFIGDINFSRKRYQRTFGVFYNNHPELLKNCMLQGYMGEKYMGEATTFYTMANFSQIYEIARNMKKVNPNMKLIYQTRNPFNRMISHYKQVTASGREKRDFSTFVKNDLYAIPNSLYFDQLAVYLEHFPPEQIKITLFEEFRENPGKVLQEIYDFLDITKEVKKNTYKKYNASRNAKQFSGKDLLLEPSQFEKLKETFSKQAEKLKQEFNVDVDWDFSPGRYSNDYLMKKTGI